MWSRAPVMRANNPVFVPSGSHDAVWERAVDVVHRFRFEIERESRIDGVIETRYKTGSNVLEPWHPESVGLYERLESTFQPIRRRVFVRVIPADGGHLVSVEAFKEIEDLDGVAATSIGGATFQHDRPLQRDLNLVVGQSRPSGWIPIGRDLRLEQKMSECMTKALDGR